MRSLSATIRNELEASRTGDFPVIFADISHPDITTIRVTSDNQNSQLSGVTYYGWSFDMVLPSDADDPSKARVTIQNVDSEIGETLLELHSPLSLTLKVFWRSDFSENTFGLPGYAFIGIGSPTPSLWWRRPLHLANVEISDEVISADVIGDELTTEPWPYHRAIRAVLPGLYR